MVVHHPYRLHKGVTDGAAHEFEAAVRQVFTQRVGLRTSCRDFENLCQRFCLGFQFYELPEVMIKCFEFRLGGQEPLGVLDCGGDLQSVADDSGVG